MWLHTGGKTWLHHLLTGDLGHSSSYKKERDRGCCISLAKDLSPSWPPALCSEARGCLRTRCAWAVGTCLLPLRCRDSSGKDCTYLRAFPAWCGDCKDRRLGRNLGPACTAGSLALGWSCKPWPGIKCLPGSNGGISAARRVRCCSRCVMKAPGCLSLSPSLQVSVQQCWWSHSGCQDDGAYFTLLKLSGS